MRVLSHTACPVRTTQNRSEATSVGGADFGHSLNLSPKPDPLHAPCPAHAPAARSHVATRNDLPLALAPGSPPGIQARLRGISRGVFLFYALKRRARPMSRLRRFSCASRAAWLPCISSGSLWPCGLLVAAWISSIPPWPGMDRVAQQHQPRCGDPEPIITCQSGERSVRDQRTARPTGRPQPRQGRG